MKRWSNGGRQAGGSLGGLLGSRSVQRVQTVFGGLISCPAFVEGGDNEIGVSADPESSDCILSVKLGPCAASGRGGNSGSVGHCWSTWTLGAVAQPVKSSAMVSKDAGFFTVGLSALLVNLRGQRDLRVACPDQLLRVSLCCGRLLCVPTRLHLGGPARVSSSVRPHTDRCADKNRHSRPHENSLHPRGQHSCPHVSPPPCTGGIRPGGA